MGCPSRLLKTLTSRKEIHHNSERQEKMYKTQCLLCVLMDAHTLPAGHVKQINKEADRERCSKTNEV